MPEHKEKKTFNGNEIEFEAGTGQVLDEKTSTSTQISSNYNAITETESINSSQTRKGSILLSTHDGKEVALNVINSDLTIRNGSNLGYVRVTMLGKGKAETMGIANLDTGEYEMNIHPVGSFQKWFQWILPGGGFAIFWFGGIFLLEMVGISFFVDLLLSGPVGIVGSILISVAAYHACLGRFHIKAVNMANAMTSHAHEMLRSLVAERS